MEQRPFSPRLDILPPPQRALWRELADTPAIFTLYGGTAIALRLGHRQSIDFDFFGRIPFEPAVLVENVPYLSDARIVRSAPNTLTARVNRNGPVQVSFFATPRLGQIEEPDIAPDNDLKIASLTDLAALKAVVVTQRAQAKDYLDMAALLGSGVDLSAALAAAEVIQGPTFSPLAALKALAYFEDGDLGALDTATKSVLRNAVKAVDPVRLPPIGYLRRYDDGAKA